MTGLVRRKKVNAEMERRLLTGMIVSTEFLRDLKAIWNPELLDLPFVRTVGQWCLDYWEQFEHAPQASIQDILATQSRRKSVPPEEEEAIEGFLQSLSEEWTEDSAPFNAQFWLDEVEKYLERQALVHLGEDVQIYCNQGDATRAKELVQGFREIKRPSSAAIEPFGDEALWDRAFAEQEQPLLKIKGALGRFLNPLIVRESLVGVMGPEKRGKTFFLTEIAFQAAEAGCNVAFFAVGDMTETQMVRRMASRLTGAQPREDMTGTVLVPVMDCARNQDNSCKLRDRACRTGCLQKKGEDKWELMPHKSAVELGYEPCVFCRGHEGPWAGAVWHMERDVPLLSVEKAKRAAKRFLALNGPRWRMFVYGAGELNVKGMDRDLEQLRQQEGWVPDVIVGDYADVMGPEDSGVKEIRHQINGTWTAFSALRRKWRAAVVTGTQTDAASYDAHTVKMKHFSEDKRKFAHVTAMIGLNQTEEEKRLGILRLGLVVAREAEFHVDRQVRVLQCPRIGKVFLDSY